MANVLKQAILQTKVEGAVFDLLVQSGADEVLMPGGGTLAQTLAGIVSDLALKQSANDVDNRIKAVVDSAPQALDTLKELADALGNDPNFSATITTALGNKIDKVAGKGLSTEDFTTALKDKLNNLKTSYTADDITETTGKVFITPAQKTEIANIANKVDKVDGKGLSANDYTTADKNKVAKSAVIRSGTSTPADLADGEYFIKIL